MINKKYWDDFYRSNKVTISESSFAKFTFEFLKDNDLFKYNLIDIGCGNGRDTFSFSKMGIKSTGIDLSTKPKSKSKNPKFIKTNLLTFNYNDYNILYLRFIIHSLTESELDILLENILNSKGNKMIFIETRSTKGITNKEKSETFFKSSIGKEHFRMLYSKEYLSDKFKKFKILYCIEDKGLAVYKNDDPYCIRYILKKVNKTDLININKKNIT